MIYAHICPRPAMRHNLPDITQMTINSRLLHDTRRVAIVGSSAQRERACNGILSAGAPRRKPHNYIITQHTNTRSNCGSHLPAVSCRKTGLSRRSAATTCAQVDYPFQIAQATLWLAVACEIHVHIFSLCAHDLNARAYAYFVYHAAMRVATTKKTKTGRRTAACCQAQLLVARQNRARRWNANYADREAHIAEC